MTATIDEGFDDEQRHLVEGHLSRALWEVLPDIRQALQETRQLVAEEYARITAQARRGPPGSTAATSQFQTLMGMAQLRSSQTLRASEVPRLEFAFAFDAAAESAIDDLDYIIGTFHSVECILRDDGTHIAPYEGGSEHPEAYLWGRADPPNRVFLGPAFFDPQADDLQLTNVPAGTFRLKAIRDGTLVHECVHCRNVRGQHEARGRLDNPYRYGGYVTAFVCRLERLEHTPVELERLVEGR
jgi:hypothetical protein